MVLKLILTLLPSLIACRAFKPQVNSINRVPEKTPGKPVITRPDDDDKKPSVEVVETLKVVYIKINEVDVPTLSFKKNDPNTYVKYKACNTENNCIRGEAYKDLHAVRNFPIGLVTISYQTCKIKSDLTEKEQCSDLKSFTSNYNPQTPEDSPLSQLLGEQAILEEQMGEQARKIKSITSHIDTTINQCKDPVFNEKIGSKERELIKKIAGMNVEDIIDALSIAGNVGELWELSKIEDERKEAEKKEKELIAAQNQATKVATVNFLNGILVAGAAVGTYHAVQSVYHWQVFWRQQRVLYDEQNEKFVLERQKGTAFLQAKGNKLPGRVFLEDPFTFEIYEKINDSNKTNLKLHTGNDKQVKPISIPDAYEYTRAGLIIKDSKPYLPHRTKLADGSFSFGEKLSIETRGNSLLRYDSNYKNNYELRKAKKDYYSNLGKYRHPDDPLKGWGRTSSFYSGSIQALSIIGAVATLAISAVFFEEGFHLQDKSYTKPCQNIIANLHQYNEEFKQAYSIYTRLLQIKIEIYMII